MPLLPVADPRSFSYPVLIASAIVICIMVSMSSSWVQNDIHIVQAPKTISARIVHINKPKPKTVTKPVTKKAVVQPKKIASKPRPIKESEKAVVKQKPKAVNKPLPLPGADLSQALVEAEEQMKLTELLNSEAQALQAERDQQAIASYAGQIKSLIQSVWRFPPSAKHEQVVLLRIFMVPTGEVTDVQVVESSGNSALDRSAEKAVWRVARFPVPKDSSLFEQQFRNFLIQLKPENARL
ncbi:MAG: colicin import membrane protein [Bermanella sp.]|jgi:colicin import membrane protein